MLRDRRPGGRAWVLDLFPALRPRLRPRPPAPGPKVLLRDEPSEGLMPTLIRRLLDTIRALKVRQVGVLLVEQKIDLALRVADRVALLENGSIRYESTPEALASNP